MSKASPLCICAVDNLIQNLYNQRGIFVFFAYR